ncbi:MAG: prolyl oligopeptidase family serine peptidase [Gemmatimonadaceae bacterium]
MQHPRLSMAVGAALCAMVASFQTVEAQRRAAQLPPLIPLTHFFDNPEIAGAQISPDGKWLSYLKPYKEKLNVHIRPISGQAERRLTSDTTRPVTGYFWSSDSRHVLYVQDKGGNENYHVYRVPIAGTGVPEAKDLTPFEGVRAIIFAVPRDMPGRILIGLNKRTPSAFDAYWLDLATGDTTVAARNPGRILGYLLDDEHRLRAATGSNDQGGTDIYAMTPGGTEWRKVASYPATENVAPLRIHPNGRQLYMSSNHGETDLAQLVLLDLEGGQTTTVESDPEKAVDFGRAFFSELTDSLLATVYVADTVRIYPKNPRFARDVANVKRLHDGTPGITSMTLDEMKYIVTFDSPTDPGATYLYDRATGRARFRFRPRPRLVPRHLAPMRAVSYKAADGLTIHGYLTAPIGVPTRNLPLVLVVHGGPWARDTWGYDAEAQLLANRGYAVMQVNYRGSTGYGKAFYNAAVKEWAGKMHSDLIDGVRWAIKEGIADSSRVAIYGGSYGGYATLVGLTFTPEVFACGVDYVGPSSLVTLIESFPAYWKPFLEGSFYRHVGNPSVAADVEDMKKRSPLFFVDRIRDPLLIVQGANDPRVTKLEADQMAIALRDRGVKVRYLLASNEGHGFLNADNRLALYRSMELFFKDCLGGRAQATVAPAIEQHIQRLTVNVDTLELAPREAEATAMVIGDPTVSTSRLGAATETRRLVLVQGGQQREVGSLRSETIVTEVGGRRALLRVQTLTSPMLGTGVDTVVVDRATLAPIRHRSANARRTMSLDYRGDSIVGSVTPTGGSAQAIALRPDTALFDANSLDLILRALPLAEGYAVRQPVYLHEGGGKVWVTSRVTGSEQVTGDGGAMVDAWVVESKMGPQTFRFWVAKDSREVLQSVLDAAPGVQLKVVR